ncbi:MAG: proton-conducting transporter membrane subunit [Bacteroidia bacterium]|nr:proton-conducting transporter membrane subunit [Bacteroidia bacterium]
MVAVYFISALLIAITMLTVRRLQLTRWLILLFVFFQWLFNVYVLFHAGETELVYFTYDPAGVLFLGLLTLISTAVVIQGFPYFTDPANKRFSYYYAALTGLIAAITGAYLANDITLVWILVEATTLTASVLIYSDRTLHALEATWKYIFITSAGIALAYMGILFLSLSVKGTGMTGLSFAGITSAAHTLDPIYLKIAFLFVLTGYSTKMELFPMHTVGIDANSVALPPVGALISTGLVNLGFLSIFRVYKALSGSPIFGWMNKVLILAGVLSILVAAGYMLKAKHTKRMLAYSTLENMGLVAIAIGIGGIGYYAAFLLLVLHTLTKSSLFFQVGQMGRVLGTYKLDESGLYLKLFPTGAIALLIGMLAILAIPPSGLFVSEFLILAALVAGKSWFVLVLVLILLCCVIYAMSTRVLHLLFSHPRENAAIYFCKMHIHKILKVPTP